jgi:membrane-associated phospholipid phosphatase
MFQTELNAWLQSFSTPWLDILMQSVSFVGNGEFIAALLIVLIFGFRLRLGTTVLLAVLIGSAVTNTLKRTFEYPRPVFLSAEVGEPGDSNPPQS